MQINKILYVAPRFHTNQVPIVRYLLEKGIEVHYLVARVEPTEDHNLLIPLLCKGNCIYNWIESLLGKNKSLVWKENFRMQHFIPSIRFLLKTIRCYKPDVIIYREPTIFSLFTNWIACLMRIPNRIMYIQSPCYHTSNTIKRRILLRVRRFLFSSKVFSPVLKSNSSLDESLLYKQEISFIPFVMNTPLSNLKRTYSDDEIVRIIDVGKYRDYKNHFVLVDAVDQLSREYKNQLKVTIVGQCVKDEEINYFNHLQQYITTKKLDSIIQLLSNVPFHKMDSLYFMNDVFVLTSKRELASIAIIEAMSKGLICVSTDNNGTANYIPKQLGYTFLSDCASDLSKVIKHIIDNKASIPEKGYATIKYTMDNFSPEVYYEKLKEIID